ncbi:hypothetical protein [Rossellomorea aquimaris]|uniref:hypothetical protein n=1 Tax=Rossellomorea aquimaris TaxID=189382 RepID=UPI0005C925A9|nr:hypothetical protein [Rossellomorea aquimaris]
MKTIVSILFISLVISVTLLPSGYGYWKKSLVFTGNITELQKTQPLQFTKITGGGKQSGNSFGFTIHALTQGMNVQLEYNDHQPATDIKQIKVNDKSATNIKQLRDKDGFVIGVQFNVTGVVKSDSSDQEQEMNLDIKIVDRGEPGNQDGFELKITNGQYEGYTSGNEKIESGNITIHGTKKKGKKEDAPKPQVMEEKSENSTSKEQPEIKKEEIKTNQQEAQDDEQVPEETNKEEITEEQAEPVKEEPSIEEKETLEQPSNDSASEMNSETSSEDENIN